MEGYQGREGKRREGGTCKTRGTSIHEQLTPLETCYGGVLLKYQLSSLESESGQHRSSDLEEKLKKKKAQEK